MLIDRNSEEAEWFVQRGICYYYSDELNSALCDLNAAIELKSDEATYYAWKGIILTKIHDMKQALEVLKYGSSIDPRNKDVIEAYAQYYISDGDINTAIQCLKKVLEIEPTDYSSFRSLIICLYNKGQYDEVIEKTNMLNSKIQDKSTIYFVRAIAFAKKEKYEEALKEVKRAIELNPDNNVYQRIYGALLLAVHGSFNMNFNSSEI